MASIMGLHMQYRLWIAEMNADIDVLRIFDDYLIEMETRKNSGDMVNRIKDYQEQFLQLRNNIDELKHDMHINKMSLAAISKKISASVRTITKKIKHRDIKNRYRLLRRAFNKTKREFQKFENKLLGKAERQHSH